MSDVLNRVRRICVVALPARDCLQSGVSRRGGVRRSAASGVVSRSVMAALVVGAVWGCGNDGGDTPSGPGSSLEPGASSGVAPNDTAQGNVAPVAPGSNGTGSTDTGANGTGSTDTGANGTGSNNIAPNGTGANGSTDTGSNSEPNSSSPTGATGGVAPVTPAGSTGDDGVTGPPNDVSPMPSNTAGTEPGGGDQTTTPTSDTDTVGNTGEQTDSTEVDTTNDTTDAQTTDEPTEPSPGSADCGSLLLCDDFEGVAAGDAPNDELWSLPMGRPANAVVVSAEQQRSGNQSVKVTYGSDNGGAPSMFYNTSIFPLPGNVVHFRAWVRFESSWENHITFAAVGPLPIEEWGDEIRFGGQHGIYYVNQAPSDSFSPNPWECTDCIAPTPETWTCLRGMFDFDQLQATLHVGDSIAVDLARDGWRNNEQISFPANPERFGLGFIDHNGSGPITAYFDDVALGYEPIPCE